MAKQFRESSMGAADQKSDKTFMIVAAIIYLLIILTLLGVWNTFFHGYYDRAPAIANVLGILCIIASYGALYTSSNSGKWGWRLFIIGILLVGGIALACGFNFDLKGIG